MPEVTILVPIVDELHLLKGCISQIRKFGDEHIIIFSQAAPPMQIEIENTYGGQPNIDVIHLERAMSYGYALDMVLRHVDTDYFCSIDADAFPISGEWLRKPVELLERHGGVFVGNDTGLGLSYKNQGEFICVNNWYRVGRTDYMKILSSEVGFSRKNNWHRTGLYPKRFKEINWEADDGVYANWYAEQMGWNKIVMPLTGAIGATNQQGLYGIVAGDLVFHFVFGNNMNLLSASEQRVQFGEAYLNLMAEIKTGGLGEQRITELLQLVNPIPNDGWYLWNSTDKLKMAL